MAGPAWRAPRSIVICIALGSPADDLAAELLVRLLRSEGIDARHFSTAELDAGLPPGANPDGVAIGFLVSAFPCPERGRADSIRLHVQELLPQADLIRAFCPGITTSSESESDHQPAVSSLGQAIEFCMSCQTVWSKEDLPDGHRLIDVARAA
jgi:hypothetical protein